MSPLATYHHYDQLNRIAQQHATDAYDYNANKWIAPSSGEVGAKSDCFMQFAYDPNGNILTMQRNGNPIMNHNGLGTHAFAMDDLKYNYNYDGNGNLLNNKLRSVQDGVVGSANVNGTFTNNRQVFHTTHLYSYQYAITTFIYTGVKV